VLLIFIDDNGVVDMNCMMDNLEKMVASLEMGFAYLKNKQMLERQETKPNKETPFYDDTTDEDIAEFEVPSKSKSSTSKSRKGYRNCILGLVAPPTWSSIGNKIFGTRKPKDAIVTGQDRNGKKKGRNLIQSFDDIEGSYVPMIEQIDILGILHLQSRLFESRGCLLLVCRHDIDSKEFTIYEIGKGCPVWKVRLNIEDNDHPIMTILDIPHGLHRGSKFLESFGGHINDPMLLLMELPHMFHIQGKFFKSCGCLLLVWRDDIRSKGFTIYEMMKGSFVWSSICLGEVEEDAFVVINISGEVVKYHLISKTNIGLFDIGTNEIDDDDDDDDAEVEFIPHFDLDPMSSFRLLQMCGYQLLCRKIPNLDPPVGIFANHHRSLYHCDFVSLDLRLNSKKSNMYHSFGSGDEADHVRILQSCNGLLLCTGSKWPYFYYVYNPSTNLFKRLPQANYYLHDDLEGLNRELKHCKFNIEDNDHPIMTSLDIHHGLHRGRKFLESFGGPCNDLILLLMEIPHMLHLKGKFVESCGCLLLICRDEIGSTNFTIYKMIKGSSVWSVRYLVNIEQLMNPLPEGWSIQTSVWSICVGEVEEDAFVVINISRKVVKYNLISKTTTEIFV
ncbi:hypothetical protein Tco_1141171, partial [Tanacetum coccineum]